MVFLNLLTFGLWSKFGRLTHYAFDAVLISAFLAGMKRSTGLTCPLAFAFGDLTRPSIKSEKVSGENKDMNKWIDKYLGVGEWVMDQSVALAGSSSWFERTR
ncbi:hypothetical protein F503_06358 [Ophiostoma piceae UAMH 11346]|uniref:Duf1748 domain containing protein n=1 Tax=Ophiostoma piceae (strain UAMH 11346) TaxID=1262450 RepID=S3BU74_OPHP1|nr:hypothetical protein F503_06358 [Ophiostoma piceae UAMH 11346]